MDNRTQSAELSGLVNNQPYMIINNGIAYNNKVACAATVGPLNTTTIATLVPDYLSTVPVDPDVTDISTSGSGYYVMKKGDKVVAGRCNSGVDLSTGIVGLWHMDESAWASVADEVIDSSGYGYHARSYPSSANHPNTISDAKVGSYAGRFDGTDDYVRKSTPTVNLNLSSAWTISVWVRFHDVSSIENWRQGLIFRGGGTNYYIWYYTHLNTANNRLYVGFKDGDNVNYRNHSLLWLPSDLNQWYHFVYTFDYNDHWTSLYINGVAVINESEMNDPLATDSVLDFGKENGYLDGDIDEVVIWSRALTGLEVCCFMLYKIKLYLLTNNV